MQPYLTPYHSTRCQFKFLVLASQKIASLAILTFQDPRSLTFFVPEKKDFERLLLYIYRRGNHLGHVSFVKIFVPLHQVVSLMIVEFSWSDGF